MPERIKQVVDAMSSLGVLEIAEDGTHKIKDELPPLTVDLHDAQFSINWSLVPGANGAEKLCYVFSFLTGFSGMEGIEDHFIQDGWKAGAEYTEDEPPPSWLDFKAVI